MAERRYTINAFTIDLRPPRNDVGEIETASGLTEVRRTALLDLLSQEDVKATFFVDPALAEVAPGMLLEIAGQGHEIAQLVSSPDLSNPSHFRQSLSAGKNALQSLIGRRLLGCRVYPLLSSGKRSMEEYAALANMGFVYSSSSYPPRDIRLGLQNSKRRAWTARVPNGVLWELPLTAWRPCGLGPVAVRSAHPERYPTWTIARNIDGMNRHGEPALLSLHCIFAASTDKPDITGRTAERLRRIFGAYRFSTTFDAFASRLTQGFDDTQPGTLRRTGIIRCDARTAATIL